MIRALVLSTAMMATTTIAKAEILTLMPGANIIADVNISTGGISDIDNRRNALATVGKGLRQKKRAGFVWLNVYVDQVLSKPGTSIKGLSAEKALATLAEQDVFAVHLSMLRDVDIQTMSDAFAKSLEANGAGRERSAVTREFLSKVAELGDTADRKNLIIVGERLESGKEILTIENTATGTVRSIQVESNSNLMRSILAIWFGVIPTGDAGLTENQKQLLQGV